MRIKYLEPTFGGAAMPRRPTKSGFYLILVPYFEGLNIKYQERFGELCRRLGDRPASLKP
jgi:hypothetical protein